MQIPRSDLGSRNLLFRMTYLLQDLHRSLSLHPLPKYFYLFSAGYPLCCTHTPPTSGNKELDCTKFVSESIS